MTTAPNVIKSKSPKPAKVASKATDSSTKSSKSKSSKASKSMKGTTAPAVEVAPVAPAVEVAPVVEVAPATEPAPTAEQVDAFKHLLQCVMDLQNQLKNLNNEIRSVEKNYKKQIKDLQKSSKSKKSHSADPNKKKSLSGFVKPTNITAELSTFLDVSPDTLIARTDVTRHINNYIKEHKLYNSETKIITPDKKLKALLKSGDDKLTYFKGNNIQKYMKIHYVKPAPVVVAVTPEVSS